MSVNIEGVIVDNPTATWMQLKSTRESVLDRKSRWNSSGWFDGDDDGGSSVPTSAKTPWTMCLANALRYVVRGQASIPHEYSRDSEKRDIVEEIVLVAINKTHTRSDGAKFTDIPEFNDAEKRRFEEVIAVLDKAIEIVAPYAKTEAVVFAADVLTAVEKEEIADKVRTAENELWSEWVYGPVRRPYSGEQVGAFRDWLTEHEQRGWGTFWDELLGCDENDPECREHALAT